MPNYILPSRYVIFVNKIINEKRKKILENNNYEFKKIKKKTLPMSVVEQIQTLINQGQLKVNDKLPSERELSSKLGVSRPSIREAMRILESLGIVSVKSGSGAYLNSGYTTADDIAQIKERIEKYTYLELVEARKILESEIALLAAKNATANDFEAITEAYKKMEFSKSDENAFIIADFAFHMAIADASKNRVLKAMLKTTRKLLVESNVAVVKVPKQMEVVMHLHGRIMEDLLLHNGDKARADMLDHLENIEEVVNKIYSSK
jgi:GntR family transcriptional regulator, transcriptional repressor for pyruvate dehydrogenase complex